MQTIADALKKLSRSNFRSSFHLNDADLEFISDKGMEVITAHARDFVGQKLATTFPVNDGKQTPMKGHPVFKAMHATGCCCRGCLQKWYRVPIGVPLSDDQQERIVRLLIAWIDKELKESERVNK